MNEKNKNKQIAKISVFITSVFVIFLSISYAFITDTLTGSKSVVINAGVLDLVLEEENEITLSDALPMYDEVGMIQDEVFNFKLVNNTLNDTNYKLMLNKISTSNELATDIVKYYLTKDGVGTPKLLSTVSSDNVVDEGTIEGNKTINYSLRLWIDSSVDDNTLISGKSLSYKVNVEASQVENVSIATTLRLESKVDTTTIIDFTLASSETNGNGIYKYKENGEDIYYWRGAVTDNHVIFGGYCWEMVRTTSTGGVKMIYDGEPVEGKCTNTGDDSILGASNYNINQVPLTLIGYMYDDETYRFGGTQYEDRYDEWYRGNYTPVTLEEGVLFGNDVEWDGNKYTLKAKEGDELFSSTVSDEANLEGMKYNHYTCLSTENSCDKVMYIYEIATYNGLDFTFFELTNGKKIEDAVDEIFSNSKDSTIKAYIEEWFSTSSLNTEENLKKIEDAVYCNDRSIVNISETGWSKDGDASKHAYTTASERLKNGTPELDCRNAKNNRDRFTYKDTVNGNGKLNYPIGLLNVDEVILAGGGDKLKGDFYLNNKTSFSLMSSPDISGFDGAYIYLLNSNPYYYVDSGDARPVISLDANVKFVSGGDGTEANPYVVK